MAINSSVSCRSGANKDADLIIFAFAMFLGIHSLLNLHWNRMRRQVAGWGYSLVVYAGFTTTLILAIINRGEGPLERKRLVYGPRKR